MRKLLKLFLTSAIVSVLVAAFVMSISASDFETSRSYFASSGQSKAFFADKNADSTVTRGEAAEFLAGYAKKSASLGIITAKNTDKIFTDGGSYSASITTVFKYGVMLPVSADKFGTEDKISDTEFLSAWLTILGYSADAGDFLYEFPYDCAGNAGIVSAVSADDLTFTQMLDISMRAIGADFKGRTTSLVSSAAYAEAAGNISDSAENVTFKGALSDDVFLPLGNVCGADAKMDFRFDVSVSKGNEKAELDVYKLTEITASDFTSVEGITPGKRYVAFDFSGAVTIDISLKNDVFSYDIRSTSSDYTHSFTNGMLSIAIAKAQTIRVTFNGNTEQEIYVFAKTTGSSVSANEIKNTTVNTNLSSASVEYFFEGGIYINEYRIDTKNGSYFSTGLGTLICASDLCEHFGLDSSIYDFGKEYYFNGVPYVAADAVNEALGFSDCIISFDNETIKYVYPDYVFDIDHVTLRSAANDNLSLTRDSDGNYRLNRVESGFGGLIANVTEQFGLSGGCLDLDFDAFASENTKITATLVARGSTSQYASASFSLSGDTRRCSYQFTLSDLNSPEYTEIYLIISPADSSSPAELSYTVAGNTITREEFYQQTQLVIYPEYPEQVNRIYDYKVTVTQGDRTEQIPVYNHTMWYALGNRTVGGDSYRRFSAFAFSGGQVRVDIKVSCDVECYSVMPSALGLKSTFKDGVISVYLDEPEYFLVRLNNRDTSIISVFADYPEFFADIPAKEDENVIWIDGWYEPSEEEHVVSNGTVIQATLNITEPNTILYIAPGAVLNARTRIASTAINTKVIGRGAIVDPYGNIYKTDITQGGNEGTGYRPLAISANGVYVDGITVLDARSFNITVSVSKNDAGVEIRNVKALATMMTTDGISLYGGTGHKVENCFLYVGDNAFVYSCSGAYIKNCIIGTTCAAFFPQGSTSSIVFENCHVFAAYGGLINNRYNGSESTPVEDRVSQTHENTFINLDASDCVFLSWFFQGRNMGDLPKKFVFDGVSIPDCTGTDNIHSTNGSYEIKLENSSTLLFTENYTIEINNLYVDGRLVESSDDIEILVSKTSSQKVAGNTLIFTSNGKYSYVKQHNVKAGYTLPDKIYVGSMLATFEGEVVRIDGELAMPADEITEILRTSVKPATTQYGGKSYIKASALVSSGAAKAVTEENGNLYITPTYNGENLLLPDTGEVSRYTETTCYQVELLTQTDTDGDWIYVMQSNPKSPNVNAGIARFVTDEIKMYGAGTYVLSFKAKASEAGAFKAAIAYDGEDTQYANFKVHSREVSTEWKTYTLSFDITEEVVQGEMIIFRFYGSETVLDQIFFTDIELIKK